MQKPRGRLSIEAFSESRGRDTRAWSPLPVLRLSCACSLRRAERHWTMRSTQTTSPAIPNIEARLAASSIKKNVYTVSCSSPSTVVCDFGNKRGRMTEALLCYYTSYKRASSRDIKRGCSPRIMQSNKKYSGNIKRLNAKWHTQLNVYIL